MKIDNEEEFKIQLRHDRILFDNGIARYLPTLRRLGWTQHLASKSVFIGDLEQEEINKIIETLADVDKFGFTVTLKFS